MSETPNFGALLLPVLSKVPADGRTRFLALLERTAAARYRGWATDMPAAAEVLLACADREDAIADRIEAAFPIDAALLAELQTLLPEARDLYYGAFAGHPTESQLRMQADAELQGAAAWRSIAGRIDDPALIAALEACSAIEEESSRAVSALLASADG